MTAKHRNKNNASANNNEKNAPAPQQQDDVAKKSQKATKAETLPVPAPHPKSSSGSGTCMKLLAALCYISLVTGAGFASFYLQQVLEEVSQISNRHEESSQKNAELAQKVESVLQQVGWSEQ